ncbi:Hypothetical predicted protein [Mytilus galloprovincialis]|uniref:C2H2-type domain-containing protein n=1 Tax=Mytilus galloprovincialis TaxID=29158 RepID=A0A8B6EU52_MYTGA|nr:Hypothetical predicted protein [Mytilus galloprovincialis]
MACIKDDGNYVIKDPEFYEINEDEIPIEDEITANENCARLFYHVKQEHINGKYIVHTVQASEEPDMDDIDNQIHQDDYHRDLIKTKRKDVKSYRRKHVGCDICLRNFPDRCTMIQHRLSHDGERAKQKQKKSENKNKNNHKIGPKIKKTKRDKTLECDICFRTLSSKSNLERHMDVHLREPVYNRTFKCQICGKTFGKFSRYESHTQTHNSDINNDNKFRCGVCGRVEKGKRDFENHMRVHTGTRPYNCDICDRSFKQKSHLRRHSRVHTGESALYKYKGKIIQCDICDRSFKQKSHLRRHSRVHTGESALYKGEIIQCDICGRNFGQNHQLIRHMKCHYPPTKKEYKCDYCPKDDITSPWCSPFYATMKPTVE